MNENKDFWFCLRCCGFVDAVFYVTNTEIISHIIKDDMSFCVYKKSWSDLIDFVFPYHESLDVLKVKELIESDDFGNNELGYKLIETCDIRKYAELLYSCCPPGLLRIILRNLLCHL